MWRRRSRKRGNITLGERFNSFNIGFLLWVNTVMSSKA